jgi:predicted nucleic acid-binding protein
MSGKPFLDTNVIVYAYRKGDPRADVAVALIASGGVIGVQQLNEFVSVARRKLRRSWEEIMSALEDLRLLCPDPRPMSVATYESALKIERRYGYGIYDALAIATAVEASCSLFYSEDMQDGQKIQGVTIRNPFEMDIGWWSSGRLTGGLLHRAGSWVT